MLNIFLFNNFFEKSSIFWENREKLFWEHIWQFFRERRRLAPKSNITFFITNEVMNSLLFNRFFQKSCIFWKNSKRPFLGPSLLKGMGRMNVTFFIGNEVLNIFHLTIFLKKATFLEKMGKNNFGGTTAENPFLRGHDYWG